jgi:hypothetical protein
LAHRHEGGTGFYGHVVGGGEEAAGLVDDALGEEGGNGGDEA